MQNDVLKNNIAPWQEKGRWYHFKVEKTAASFKLLNDFSDQFIIDNFRVVANYIIHCPKDNVILQSVIKYEPKNGAQSTLTASTSIYLFSSQESGITLSTNFNTGTIFDIWSFIV